MNQTRFAVCGADPISEPGKFIDGFSDIRSAGRVIGTTNAAGVVRTGVDKEGVLGIDNGALRIQPLTKPGWGRAGIAYGPYTRQNGLTFGVFLLNGHNTSQGEPLSETIRQRLKRWALGSETEKPIRRIIRWARSRQKKFIWRTLVQWIRTGSRFFRVELIDENLAVGWFPSVVTTNPLQQGNSFIVHALGPECGELWARVGSTCQRTLRGLQNVQTHYIVVLREKGAAYYGASIPRVPGLDAYPRMRLLAIDALNSDRTVYAGIHQSVLGQVGFRVDTRVYRTQVATLPEFGKWYGSAHGADSLRGRGPLHLSDAEIGGNWTVYEGGFQRTDDGVIGMDVINTAMLKLPMPSGFLHALIQTTDKPVEGIAVIWRGRDEDNFWSFEVSSRHCQLVTKESGIWSRFPATKHHYLAPNAMNSIQVGDDGENIRLYVNGELIFGTTLSDARSNDATGIGIRVVGGANNGLVHSFETHPRSIPVPEAFDLGSPWISEGNRVCVEDDFVGSPADLIGRITRVGAKTWRREVGQGVIELTGEGSAKVHGTVKQPCPGRTAYTLPWSNPGFADVGVNITPPGTSKGQGERGRGGLIFWQDARNYVIVSLWMDDSYGFSISSFFHVDGYEELYDAVWTNIGRRIYWGIPYDFQVVFDGKQFLAFVNGEPVLYRALADIYASWKLLPINRIGIVANWEWGNDTGSIFRQFVAKDQV